MTKSGDVQEMPKATDFGRIIVFFRDIEVKFD